MNPSDPMTSSASRSSREHGFTLLEIMIAVAVLVIGILGVLALFPVALKSGKETIENTNGILIAQSVEQAIREGLAHRKGQSDNGESTFFVFNHPGVKDDLPRTLNQARPNADYYILLPEAKSDRKKTPEDRVSAYDRGKLFVFPETDGQEWTDIDGVDQEDLESGAQANGGGNAERADDDSDDDSIERLALDGGMETVDKFLVMKTYSLDEEFFQHVEEDADISVGFDKRDPIRDYSFAFTMRRALNDASLGRHAPDSKTFIPGNELFEVEVLVFRSFRANTAIADNPILSTRFLVHK